VVGGHRKSVLVNGSSLPKEGETAGRRNDRREVEKSGEEREGGGGGGFFTIRDLDRETRVAIIGGLGGSF